MSTSRNMKSKIQRLVRNIIRKRNRFSEMICSSEQSYLEFQKISKETVREFEDQIKIKWDEAGNGVDYKKIEELPIEFVRIFQRKIKWRKVGSGAVDNHIGNYTKIEELPIEFVIEFQHQIRWGSIGTGDFSSYSNCVFSNYKKIEDLPIEFVREFQQKIDWRDVGTGKWNYTKKEDLPIEFVKQYRHRMR